jgi:Zn finger protein HypA/HybF involved in hydrogenase expression
MKKLTTEDFVQAASIKHDNKYSYEKLVYVNRRSDVEITCPAHGNFWQNAGHHLNGSGCPECKKEQLKKTKTKDVEYFLNRLQELETHKHVSLDKSTFSGMCTEATFSCSTHGNFTSLPTLVLQNKAGCPKCGHKNAKRPIQTNYDELIETLNKIHNNKYDYSNLQPLRVKAKQPIICPEHGEFYQSLSAHKQGSGCPSCSSASGGFDPKKPGILYYLSINNGEAYKIGITNKSVQERFNISELKTIKVVFTEFFENGQDCREKEKQILSEYKAYKYEGPNLLESGNTELFTKDVLNKDKEVHH